MLSMGSRREISKMLKTKYRHAKSKKEKSVIIDAAVEATGWHRKHAIRVLSNNKPAATKVPLRRGPKPVYGVEHAKVLKQVWAICDFPCSKRLKQALPDVLSNLEQHGYLHIESKLKEELCHISAASIDRILSYERTLLKLRGKSTTKPGSILKSQIPIRRGNEWDNTALGFMEADTVAHCGPSAKGEFCYTLDMVDVASGWTEFVCIRNKAQVHMMAAIKKIKARMPFDLKGIDSDNGSEFINKYLIAYCKEQDLVFTRSRPYTKNDGCFVEEKNWSVIRQVIGYGRYSGETTCKLINEIYSCQRILSNYFLPSAKLISRVREDSCVRRKHDIPKSPYRRILEMDNVDDQVKKRLQQEHEKVDLYELRKRKDILIKCLLKRCELL